MLRIGSKVEVVFDKGAFWDWRPGVFTVQKSKSGLMGIDYNRTHSPYCEGGEEVVPFCHFESTVLFVNRNSGTAYHWDNIKERLVYADFD